MKQHPLLGNRFLISKYMQQLLGNAFTYKHVPMVTNPDAIMEELLEAVFSAQSVPRHYQ
jgi:hypothetical protein